MKMRSVVQAIVCGVALAALAAGPVAAEEATNAPALSAAGESVNLLDDIPNYAAMLAGQWNNQDVPALAQRFATDTHYYGRLLDTDQPTPVTLADCVALTLANNTGLELSRLGPLGARAQVRRSLSIFDPSLFADVSYDRSVRPAGSLLLGAQTSETLNTNWSTGLRKTLRTGGQLSLFWRNNRLKTNSTFNDLVPQYTTDFGVSLNQPLLRDFGLGFTTLQVHIARTTEQAARKQYEAALSSTVKSVEQAYWRLVLANEEVSVQEQGLALAQELQRQNEGKFNVGAAPRTAVLEAQAEVARRDANLIKFQNARIIARDALRALVNAPGATGGALLMIEPADQPQVESYDVDIERSLATALERRPELAAARLNVESSGMQLKMAENQLLPRLNVIGSLGSNGLGGDAQPRTVSGTTVVNKFDGSYEQTLNRAVGGQYYSYSAGLSLDVPLDNAQARADYGQVRVGLEQSRRTLQEQQENVTLEIKRAVTNLESDLKSINATRIARELAEENVRNQKARYDVGLATTKDLLDFLDRLTQARALELAALTTYSIDLAELRRVEGTLLEARNIAVVQDDAEPTPWWAMF